jgi:hypothetical protein
VIERKVVDRYAHQSGVKDQLMAEREVLPIYALHALAETKTLDLLAQRSDELRQHGNPLNAPPLHDSANAALAVAIGKNIRCGQAPALTVTKSYFP